MVAVELPELRIVIPSLAMPYRARDPSIVAVFIDRTRPATMQRIITLPSALPTIVLKASV